MTDDYIPAHPGTQDDKLVAERLADGRKLLFVGLRGFDEQGNLKPAAVQLAATGQVDAFGRLRISEPSTLFDSKQLYDKAPLFWSEFVDNISGNAASTHSTVDAATTMHAESGDTIVRQSYERFNYQPGKSQLVILTGVLGEPADGAIGRIGYFDNDNGIFIERNGTTLNWVIRKAGVDTQVVPQSSWSEDKLDGTGPSGITYDPTKAVIFWIDFEWLGVGQVRCGLVVEGEIVYAHHFHHSNVVTSVYMSTPNLPVRYEVSSTGPATELVHICSSVMSEGGLEPLGLSRARSVPERTNLSSSTVYAIMGLRLKTTHLGVTLQQLGVSLYSSSNSAFRFRLLFRPTFNNPGSITWTDETNSGVQYATAVNTVTLATEGTVLDAGYMSAQVRQVILNLQNALRPGAAYDGTRDELWLVATPKTNNSSLDAALSWRELA